MGEGNQTRYCAVSLTDAGRQRQPARRRLQPGSETASTHASEHDRRRRRAFAHAVSAAVRLPTQVASIGRHGVSLPPADVSLALGRGVVSPEQVALTSVGRGPAAAAHRHGRDIDSRSRSGESHLSELTANVSLAPVPLEAAGEASVEVMQWAAAVPWPDRGADDRAERGISERTRAALIPRTDRPRSGAVAITDSESWRPRRRSTEATSPCGRSSCATGVARRGALVASGARSS
jgi:hypothetical protein